MATQHIGKKSVDVDGEITLEKFCWKMNYNYDDGIFFEADLSGDIDCTKIHDVILMDKVNVMV